MSPGRIERASVVPESHGGMIFSIQASERQIALAGRFSRWRGGGFAPWGFHVGYKSLRSRRLYREPDDNGAARAGLLVRESYCILPCTGDPRVSTACKCSHCFPRPCGFLMTKSDYFSSPTNIHKFRALVTVSPKRVGLRGAEAKSELGFDSVERRSAAGEDNPDELQEVLCRPWRERSGDLWRVFALCRSEFVAETDAFCFPLFLRRRGNAEAWIAGFDQTDQLTGVPLECLGGFGEIQPLFQDRMLNERRKLGAQARLMFVKRAYEHALPRFSLGREEKAVHAVEHDGASAEPGF